MKVLLIETEEVVEVNAAYGVRLIEQGKALTVKPEKRQRQRQRRPRLNPRGCKQWRFAMRSRNTVPACS